jgi:hypothetical protein
MAAAHAAPRPSALSPLTLTLVLHVFSLLPADDRARAACVCRGWRVTLDEVSLWRRLDLSPSRSGVRVRVTGAVLAGASAKARGQLAALDVSGCDDASFEKLLAVVQANGGALRELCAGGRLNTPQTAPRELSVDFVDDPEVATEEDEDPVALAAELAAHASLQRFTLANAPLYMPGALDAVVDAALARQFVRFWGCSLLPASAPALARLLGGSTLRELELANEFVEQLLDGLSAALLGDALRANSTLTSLSLYQVGLDWVRHGWHDMDVWVARHGRRSCAAGRAHGPQQPAHAEV